MENSTLEFEGTTSRGKSALLTAVASGAWGWSPSKHRFGKSWNTTGNKAEDDLPLYNHTITLRDEATVANKNAKLRSEDISNFIHRFSGEEIKDRMGEENGLTFRTFLMSRSNQSLLSILDETSSVKGGVGVRILTANTDNLLEGIFDSVPKGSASSFDADSHYGHLAHALAKAIVEAEKKEEGSVSVLVSKYMRYFLDKNTIMKSDIVDFRTYKPLALSYAALRLCKDWDCLPSTIGNLLQPLSRAYLQIKNGTKKVEASPLEPFLKYARQHAKKIVGVHNSDKPMLSDEEFNKIPAFIY